MSDEPNCVVWLSFCDGDRPAGDQFLGACIVRIHATDEPRHDTREAIQAAWRLGCNPGGECRLIGGWDFPDTSIIPEEWIGRLLTREKCEEFDRLMLKEEKS